MNQPRVGAHVPPHHELASHLPHLPIPLGCPRALTLSALLHVGRFITVSPEVLLLRHNYH